MIRVLPLLLMLSPFAAAAPIPREVKKQAGIDGLWEVASMEVLGKPRPLTEIRWRIEGDKITVLHTPAGAAATMRSVMAIKVAADATPKTIDYNTGGGRASQGLYEVDGGTLKVVLDLLGTGRPAALKSDANTVYYTFKRVKE